MWRKPQTHSRPKHDRPDWRHFHDSHANIPRGQPTTTTAATTTATTATATITSSSSTMLLPLSPSSCSSSLETQGKNILHHHNARGGHAIPIATIQAIKVEDEKRPSFHDRFGRRYRPFFPDIVTSAKKTRTIMRRMEGGEENNMMDAGPASRKRIVIESSARSSPLI